MAEIFKYTIAVISYAMLGGYFIRTAITKFKDGEYFFAGCSFLLTIPNIVLIIREAWML
jgi:hypothetical protein